MYFFLVFFYMELMQFICNESNLHRELLSNIHREQIPQSEKRVAWSDVTVPELYLWLALTILMPHLKKHLLKDYWSVDELLETPIFGR